jgi:hypothetical protein
MQTIQEPSILQAEPTVSPAYSILDTRTGKIQHVEAGQGNAISVCKALEAGGIIYFPESPIAIDPDDITFLLKLREEKSAYHKNIAYRPALDRLTGFRGRTAYEPMRLQRCIKGYSKRVKSFLADFLVPYADHCQLDYASFRPFEEQGRKLRLRARNDLIHVDSFPTRPIFGKRILRFFNNLSPDTPRIWQTSDPFDVLLERYKADMPSPWRPQSAWEATAHACWDTLAKPLGFKRAALSPYDAWMTRFHNFLKENAAFQQYGRKDIWALPAGSSWMVLTDMVSHSVLSGQYAMEQTLLIEPEGLQLPELSPLCLLERSYPRP